MEISSAELTKKVLMSSLFGSKDLTIASYIKEEDFQTGDNFLKGHSKS